MLHIPERQPDLVARRPLDVWVLGFEEEAPEGAITIDTPAGVRIAFRPAKEVSNENERLH